MGKYNNYHAYKHHNKSVERTTGSSTKREIPSDRYISECHKLIAKIRKIKTIYDFHANRKRLQNLNISVKRFTQNYKIEFTFLTDSIKIVNEYNYYIVYDVSRKYNIRLNENEIAKLNEIIKTNYSKVCDAHKEINNAVDFFQYNEKSVDNENTTPVIIKSDKFVLGNHSMTWNDITPEHFNGEVRYYTFESSNPFKSKYSD